MTGDFLIRPAADFDAAAGAVLMTALGYPTNESEMAGRLHRILARHDFVTFVAEAEGAVVGLAGVQLRPSYMRDGVEAYLMALVVAAAARGRGIGEALLRAAEQAAAAAGARRLTLTSASHRQESHAWYLRRGYASTGLRFARDLDSSRGDERAVAPACPS
jgi:GNAT superfamily N-acetyltransferase